MKKLSETEVSSAVTALSGWSVKDAKLHREYKFPDFKHAMDFMVAAVPGIEHMDCLLYTSPSPRDRTRSRMPSSA